MKLLKRGLMVAILSVSALALTSSVASATIPSSATGGHTLKGFIEMDGSLGGSTCGDNTASSASSISISTAGDAVSTTIGGCTGAAGTPYGVNEPFALNWNAGGTGGTVAVEFHTDDLLGYQHCEYSGTLNFTYSYSGGVRTVTLSGNLARKAGSPGFPCPSSVAVNGTFSA